MQNNKKQPSKQQIYANMLQYLSYYLDKPNNSFRIQNNKTRFEQIMQFNYRVEDHSWENLRMLSIYSCHVSPKNFKLISSKKWPRLEELIINHNELDFSCIKQLCQMQLPSLKKLKLDKNNLNPKCLQLIWNNNTNQNLTMLSLKRVGLQGPGMKTLLDRSIKSLTYLSLSNNAIGSMGIKHLTKTQLPHLNQLSMYSCRVGVQGIKHLLKAHFPNITILKIWNNKVESIAFAQMNCSYFYKMKQMCLIDSNHQNYELFVPIDLFNLMLFRQRVDVRMEYSKLIRQKVRRLLEKF